MPARLHHERIARTGTTPARWIAITHGIFGAGSNWRGIARKVNERRPDWGVVLVDLRQHGRSEPGDPPHTVAACADDLAALIRELGDVRALAGHSFGGKTAIATRAIIDLDQTWVLDASPSARPGAFDDPDNSVVRVLALMERLPARWPSRDAFVSAVVAEGHDTALAQWLAMNLVPEAESAPRPSAAPQLDHPDPASSQLVNRLDLSAIRQLLASYYALDLWDTAFAPRGDLEIVIAGRSSTLSADDRRRLDAAPPHVHVEIVDAGHWLHIEAAAAVIELFATRLPR